MNYTAKKPPKRKTTDNVIEVLLGTEPGTLDIDDHDVHGNSIKQSIVWQLDKTLEAGNFLSFEWQGTVPVPGTFDTPEITPDGNSLTIGVHNGKKENKGSYAYVLTVEFGGRTYTSRTQPPDSTIKDPIIINR